MTGKNNDDSLRSILVAKAKKKKKIAIKLVLLDSIKNFMGQ